MTSEPKTIEEAAKLLEEDRRISRRAFVRLAEAIVNTEQSRDREHAEGRLCWLDRTLQDPKGDHHG